MARHKVADHPDLLKDDNGYVVNKNVSEYEKALLRRKKIEEDADTRRRVLDMEDKLNQILALLKK